MVRVYIHTLGCRLNQYESDGILSELARKGEFTFVSEVSSADLAIVNTCTVTDQADRRNRQTIQRIKKQSPAAPIIVTGCQAHTDPDQLAQPGVHVVSGQAKHTIAEMIVEFIKTGAIKAVNGTIHSSKNAAAFAFVGVLPQGHTRAYLKIQDGCDRRCTYCKIPQARGRGTSRDVQDVLDEVDFLRERGIKEVVLTGVNLGWYRAGSIRFTDLLRKILDHCRGMRLRLSSIEPCDVGHELAEIFQHSAFCKYLHVPLQSGSDTVLRKMRRTYHSGSFRQRIEHFYRKNPDLFVGTDVIVGFPGETAADFQSTVSLLSDLTIARIHAFPYSVRQHTLAASFGGTVESAVKKERLTVLRDLEQLNWTRYARRFSGKVRQGLAERSRDSFRALTDNYLRLVSDQKLVPGRLYNFTLEGPEKDRVGATCQGEADQVVCS
ncbi:MAG: tRNA (N(6)-L-threonylcarbamoyladenosine(37)-C(2))-methylthiotransferase MtaB [Spirochaetales bacterium]|nr:tRNA (N(6)-L-threonylcarbamoyladenosine(37)-C(2))-methylthiotransferase MtaB [Spirochaetales bacterium]